MKNILEKSNKILGLEELQSLGLRVPVFSFIPDFTSLGLKLEDLNIQNPPSILIKNIKKIIGKFNLSNGVSVRSASFDEDNSKQSSAGRYLSFNGLHTKNEIVTSAIQIWLHHRKNSNNVLCPLIIQETHPSFYSGVAFKDKNLIVIESYFGACSNLVEGMVTPYYTTINNNQFHHKYGFNNSICSFSAHENIFETNNLVSGKLLQTKINGFPLNTRFHSYRNGKMIKVYGYRPLRPIDKYETKILPTIIDILNKLDNENGVDIEWGTDIEGNVYVYQYRNLTINIADLYTYHPQEQTTLLENQLLGTPTSKGKAKGKIITNTSDISQGDILFLEYDYLEDVAILKNIKGLISMNGGVLSHLSIICRELGIPCIVGIDTKIPVGTEIELDGDSGIIKIL